MDYSNNDIVNLANIIFGEAADQPYEVMHTIGSSVVNRKNANREVEFGSTIKDIGEKGYYAVINRNEPYTQALTGKFPDDKSKNSYKRAFAIASGLLKGTLEPVKGQFFFKEDEIKKLKKNPKKFDFKKVKEVGKSGEYRIFSY